MLYVENGKPIVSKNSDTMGTLIFKEVDKALAREIMINNHYSHKWVSNFGVVNIGVFKESEPDNCLGVASFGWMMNPESYKIISNDITRDEVLELNRLWVDDCLGKNTESMLLSASWKILKWYGKIKVVQSFADGRLGCGTVYKASNFKYYGVDHTGFFRDKTNGEVWFAKMLTQTKAPRTMLKLAIMFSKDMFDVFVVNTYRYIYVLDKSINILLKEQPYPEYHKGEFYCQADDVFGKLVPPFGELAGSAQSLGRAYIIAKIYNDNEGAHYIAKKLLQFYNEQQLDEMINIQKENGTLKRLYSSSLVYNSLLKVTKWYDTMVKDSQLEIDTVDNSLVTEDLWG